MKIILIGAYGFTGKLIAQYLSDYKIDFEIAGTNKDKLIALSNHLNNNPVIQEINLRDKIECQNLIQQFDVFINCAGPFEEESFQLVKLIAQSKNKYYLDISGESEFIRKSYLQNNEIAQKNKSSIIHGCAFESAIADLIVQKCISNEKAVSLETFYFFNSSKPSPGTRMTMKLSKHRHYSVWKNNAWIPLNELKTNQRISIDDKMSTPIHYPLPELVFFGEMRQTENAASYLCISPEEALFFQFEKSANENEILPMLDKLKLNKPVGPTLEERKNQSFKLLVRIDQNDNSKLILATGKDMYDITAKVILLGVQQILQSTPINGVISPSQLFENNVDVILSQLNIEYSEIEPSIIQ